jgi:phosphoenolpyruvate carboxykinase (ATP)
VVKKVEGVPDELLDPRASWVNKNWYDSNLQKVVEGFSQNFSSKYEGQVPEEIVSGGPKLE